MLSLPLLGRCRSWAVVAFSLLSLFALSCPCAAQYPGGGSGGGYPGGGSYGGPDYSGSTGQITFTATPGPNPSPQPYSLNNDGTYYASGGSDPIGGNISSGTATCSGLIQAVFTWNNGGNSNNVPPSCVIIMERCIAGWSGEASNGATVQGNCTNPLGGSAVPANPGPGETWDYTRYTVQNDPPATITLSSNPEADAEAAGSGTPNSNGVAGPGVKYNAAVIIPPPLQAHSTVDTANWDPAHPRFFSGTNCSVTGTAVAYSAPPGNAGYPNGGSYVSTATLTIGGTPVKYYYDTSVYGPYPLGAATGTNQPSVPLSVFFDSTHFADASTIPAKMTVTDSGGFTYTVNLSGPACNKLTAFANQTQSWVDYQTGENVALNATNGIAKGQKSDLNYQPYPGVVLQSQSGNISTGSSPITNHHRSDIINDIAASNQTVFFAATHADPGLLGDCYSLSDGNLSAYLSDADIQGAIRTRTAAMSAPYLFVFLHGCDSGGNTGLADDFGVTSSNDTGFAGFGAAIYVSQNNTNFTVAAWRYLMQGETLADALNDASSLYPVQPFLNPVTSPQNSGTTIPVPRGDNNMTLCGKVYNWVSGPTWYR